MNPWACRPIASNETAKGYAIEVVCGCSRRDFPATADRHVCASGAASRRRLRVQSPFRRVYCLRWCVCVCGAAVNNWNASLGGYCQPPVAFTCCGAPVCVGGQVAAGRCVCVASGGVS